MNHPTFGSILNIIEIDGSYIIKLSWRCCWIRGLPRRETRKLSHPHSKKLSKKRYTDVWRTEDLCWRIL